MSPFLVRTLLVLLATCISACSSCAQAPAVVEEGGTGAATATASAGKSHEDLDAALWLRTSAEYRSITKIVFRAATERIQQALNDKTWSALVDADSNRELPPAVILDVDETVLDNSGYQVHLIETDHEYVKSEWNEFVATRSSKAIPGAREFVDFCRNAGIKVFFITNREHSVEHHTRANLEAEGLLPSSGPNEEDTLLCKYEQEGWTSDKSTRRAHVAASYRVILLIGDDLNDFVYVGHRPSSPDRVSLANKYDERWGKTWFAIPNPNYGGWERALYEFNDGLPHAMKLQKKREALHPPSDNPSESLH